MAEKGDKDALCICHNGDSTGNAGHSDYYIERAATGKNDLTGLSSYKRMGSAPVRSGCSHVSEYRNPEVSLNHYSISREYTRVMASHGALGASNSFGMTQ